MLVCTVSLGYVLGIKATREALWKVIVNWYDDYIEISYVPETVHKAEAVTEAADVAE